jgi:hypothetical protein
VQPNKCALHLCPAMLVDANPHLSAQIVAVAVCGVCVCVNWYRFSLNKTRYNRFRAITRYLKKALIFVGDSAPEKYLLSGALRYSVFPMVTGGSFWLGAIAVSPSPPWLEAVVLCCCLLSQQWCHSSHFPPPRLFDVRAQQADTCHIAPCGRRCSSVQSILDLASTGFWR